MYYSVNYGNDVTKVIKTRNNGKISLKNAFLTLVTFLISVTSGDLLWPQWTLVTSNDLSNFSELTKHSKHKYRYIIVYYSVNYGNDVTKVIKTRNNGKISLKNAFLTLMTFLTSVTFRDPDDLWWPRRPLVTSGDLCDLNELTKHLKHRQS